MKAPPTTEGTFDGKYTRHTAKPQQRSRDGGGVNKGGLPSRPHPRRPEGSTDRRVGDEDVFARVVSAWDEHRAPAHHARDSRQRLCRSARGRRSFPARDTCDGQRERATKPLVVSPHGGGAGVQE